MNDILSKTQLLEILKSRRVEWDALLASVGEARMDIPGAAGYWSVKDIISHITAYERWLVEWLSAAHHGAFPAPSPLDDVNIERRNARVYEMTRSMPVQEVLSDATQTFIKLMKAIKALPDEYFDHPQSAEWFMKPYWSRMSTIPEAVLNLSADHYDEHIPSIKAWIEKSMEVTK